jgi:DNA-binding CsgD family transcriptional regulator
VARVRQLRDEQKALAPPEYPFHERARIAYSHWIAGYSEEEIGEYLGISAKEAATDVQHIHSMLPARTVVSHTNDRNKILIQRAQAQKYRKILGDALDTPVATWLEAGVSPTHAMREYREAVGMIAERGPSVSVQVNNQQQGLMLGERATTGISSSEDLFRRVMAEIEEPAPVVIAEAESVADADAVPVAEAERDQAQD